MGALGSAGFGTGAEPWPDRRFAESRRQRAEEGCIVVRLEVPGPPDFAGESDGGDVGKGQECALQGETVEFMLHDVLLLTVQGLIDGEAVFDAHGGCLAGDDIGEELVVVANEKAFGNLGETAVLEEVVVFNGRIPRFCPDEDPRTYEEKLSAPRGYKH